MRRLVLEVRGHVDRLHAVGCPTVHPSTGKRAPLTSVDVVLAAARAGCCQPTLDEWRMAVLDAADSQNSAAHAGDFSEVRVTQ